MSEITNTMLEVVNHIVTKHPEIASRVEKLAAAAQGKGFGTATIKQEVKAIQQLLGHLPRLAIDVGGNVGEYAAELKVDNPELEIHIFEPASINIEKLKSRFFSDSLIRIVPVALSDVTSEATLFSNEPGSGLGSLAHRKLEHFNISFNEKEQVSVAVFEDYWRLNLNSREIDVVKIDVEGYELNVLNGFGAAIEATKILQFEFGGCNIDTRTYFRDFWYFFKSKDFDIFRITPYGVESIDRYQECNEFFSTTNYIAKNKNIL